MVVNPKKKWTEQSKQFIWFPSDGAGSGRVNICFEHNSTKCVILLSSKYVMALGFNLDKPTGLTEVKITAHERYGAKHITVTE